MKKALLFLFAGGCVLPPTEAERKTYEAVAPEYRAYVENDAAMPEDAKQRRFDLIESWRIRVEAKR